jgi:hypothetical protein
MLEQISRTYEFAASIEGFFGGTVMDLGVAGLAVLGLFFHFLYHFL